MTDRDRWVDPADLHERFRQRKSGVVDQHQTRLRLDRVEKRVGQPDLETRLDRHEAGERPVPLSRFGITPGTGADLTGRLQRVVDDWAGEPILFDRLGEYRITDWLVLPSHTQLRGIDRERCIIFNDKTHATIDRRACLLVGNHHPALMSSQTAYTLNAIAKGDPSVTTTAAADAGNVAAGQLVIVGSATNVSGVPRHAQLNKVVSAVAGTGVVTLVDPIASAITDARIWTVSGTDGSTGQPIAAVENVVVENLGFKGRAAIATKGAVFGGRFRDLAMVDTHLFFGTNMLTNVLVENLSGFYSGRMLEFAFNSYNVTARNWQGRFRPPAGLQAGESMVLPIHLGEQPYRILLEDVACWLDARYTPNTELAQIKGSAITVRACDWRHAGGAGAQAITIPDGAYAGYGYEDIEFALCRLAAPGKARIVQVGGAAVTAQNPRNVAFRGGELVEAVTAESIWFAGGSGLACATTDRTGRAIRVSTTARYPNLAGYRRMA